MNKIEEAKLLAEKQKAEALVKQKPELLTEADHLKVIASYQILLNELKDVQAEFRAEVRKNHINADYIMLTIKQGIKEHLRDEMSHVHSRVDTAIKHTLHEDFKVITDSERDRQEAFYKRIFGFMDKRSVANAVVAVLLSLSVACICESACNIDPPLA